MQMMWHGPLFQEAKFLCYVAYEMNIPWLVVHHGCMDVLRKQGATANVCGAAYETNSTLLLSFRSHSLIRKSENGLNPGVTYLDPEMDYSHPDDHFQSLSYLLTF